MKVNLGCGRDIREGFVNVDSFPSDPGIVTVDLDNPAQWFFNETDIHDVTEYHLSHLIEHIGYPLQLFQAMYLAAAPGCKAFIRCPHGSSDDAHEDPTHVRAIYPGFFHYFGQPFYWRADYGYRGDWKIEELIYVVEAKRYGIEQPGRVLFDQELQAIKRAIHTERNAVYELQVTLVAVHPMREPKQELQERVQARVMVV